MTESASPSRNDAPKTDFEKWMDAVRPAWRQWKRDEHPACSQAQIADMMCEAWNAGANTVEALRSEIRRAVTDEMVDRFLNWPLPESVCSDPCAAIQGYPNRVGTNLLSGDEARQMLEYVLNRRDAPGRAHG